MSKSLKETFYNTGTFQRPDTSGIRGQGVGRKSSPESGDEFPYDRDRDFGDPHAQSRDSAGHGPSNHIPTPRDDVDVDRWNDMDLEDWLASDTQDGNIMRDPGKKSKFGEDDVDEAMGVPFNVERGGKGAGITGGIITPGTSHGWAGPPTGGQWDARVTDSELDDSLDETSGIPMKTSIAYKSNPRQDGKDHDEEDDLDWWLDNFDSEDPKTSFVLSFGGKVFNGSPGQATKNSRMSPGQTWKEALELSEAEDVPKIDPEILAQLMGKGSKKPSTVKPIVQQPAQKKKKEQEIDFKRPNFKKFINTNNDDCAACGMPWPEMFDTNSSTIIGYREFEPKTPFCEKCAKKAERAGHDVLPPGTVKPLPKWERDDLEAAKEFEKRKKAGEYDIDPQLRIQPKQWTKPQKTRLAGDAPAWGEVMSYLSPERRAQATKYFPYDEYELTQLIDHPKLGIGFVTEIMKDDKKMRVMFKTGEHVLVQGGERPQTLDRSKNRIIKPDDEDEKKAPSTKARPTPEPGEKKKGEFKLKLPSLPKSATSDAPMPDVKKRTLSKEWERFMDAVPPASVAKASAYDPSLEYSRGDLLVHPKFGIGYVKNVDPVGRAAVEFEDGERLLIHGRVGMNIRKEVLDRMVNEVAKRSKTKKKGRDGYDEGEEMPKGWKRCEVADYSKPLGDANRYKEQGRAGFGPYTSESNLRSIARDVVMEELGMSKEIYVEDGSPIWEELGRAFGLVSEKKASDFEMSCMESTFKDRTREK